VYLMIAQAGPGATTENDRPYLAQSYAKPVTLRIELDPH
jgi:hypothetical protein